MHELARWLGEQMDTDEEEARRGYLKAEPLPDYDGWDKSTAAGLPPVVAARVLREIDAKREIVRQADLYLCDSGPGCGYRTKHGHSVLRLLALPYADRPGYRDEWRP